MCLWQKTFPRFFELFLASDQSHPDNYFQHSSNLHALNSSDDKLLEWESKFSELDPKVWSQFMSKATPYVTVLDSFGFPKQLFEVFNEVEGYLYLKNQGCREITFIEPIGKGLTPDLYGKSRNTTYLLEVKTIGESDDWNRYLLSPAKTKDMVKSKKVLDKGISAKVQEAIDKARGQLSCYSKGGETKVIFLVTIFDQDCLSNNFYDSFNILVNQIRTKIKEDGFRICHIDKTPFNHLIA